MVHRDIKPQNILIADGDQVFLGDFGLALTSDTTRVTSTAVHADSEDGNPC